MKHNFNAYPYASKRTLSLAQNGVVATTQPLAAQAGLDMLKQGGNAVDAAIAAAACLTVVEPTANGIGGDAFAIVHFNGKLYGLNGSGKSPGALSLEALKAAGLKEIPRFGVIPITTPGAVKAWADLNKRFGNLAFTTVLEPAILLAEEGFPISPTIGEAWKHAFEKYRKLLNGKVFKPFFDTFTKKGAPYQAGEICTLKDHAKTLRKIASTKGESFYTGELAEQMTTFIRKHGGDLSLDDLQSHRSLWVEPLRINYRGYDIHELPPNGQGLITLQALEMLKGFAFPTDFEAREMHQQIEAMKLAFEEGLEEIADLEHMRRSVESLLDPQHLKKLAEKIGQKARTPRPSEENYTGTVYLSTADKDGNMVSFIQSNYMGFGSAITIPGTGITMQNRGKDFSTDAASPNALAGNKRSYHTIIPGFITKDELPVCSFGLMGGYMQPQGHLQLIQSILDQRLNPQAALDKPRWQWVKNNHIKVEREMPARFIETLREKGHTVEIEDNKALFGRGMIIWRLDNGVYLCGVEKRADSHAALY